MGENVRQVPSENAKINVSGCPGKLGVCTGAIAGSGYVPPGKKAESMWENTKRERVHGLYTTPHWDLSGQSGYAELAREYCASQDR